MLDLGLQARRALVAGTGLGIGRACVLALVAAGARVACVDIDEQCARAVAAEVAAGGGEALPIVADASRRDTADAAVQAAVAALGGLDVCVDVIGVARWGRMLELNDCDWDEVAPSGCATSLPGAIGRAADGCPRQRRSAGVRGLGERPGGGTG